MNVVAGRRGRIEVRAEGIVQGVGFRPYVHRLASELGLTGHVLNDERGVVIEVEGPEPELAEFLARLPAEAPPMARLERLHSERREPLGERGFEIAASRGGGGRAEAAVGPDAATCGACLAELGDPRDRRHRYPFINCTDCGPRFTIVTGIPYDRPATTMAGFTMCAACRAEYDDPGDRRFHAQPNACSDCGPSLRLADDAGRELAPGPAGEDAAAAAAAALSGGLIVAVKGLGGYHLACRADSEQAVAALRSRKHREDKPFAIMVASLERAGELVELGPAERELLSGPERPIVICRRRPGAAIADAVAPGNPGLGLMLPYTPLHQLLIGDTGLDLVMTSGNVSDEPIAFDDEDALSRLGGVADRFCIHDRPIRTRTDDSVLRAVEAGPARALLIRRSRGWVPRAVGLPIAAPAPILACGAELKSTFCLAAGSRAFPSHHIGDLKNFETLRAFGDGVSHLEGMLEIEPQVIAHDLHPDYLSTSFALERRGIHVGVQHHHAHLGAVLAEHGELGEVAGAIFDGSGYGEDGTVWGGELLVGDIASSGRAGFLFPVRLPGGDAAVRQPWRMACAWLAAAGDGVAPERPPAPLAGLIETGDWEAVAGMCRTGLASPLTTSAGRLFDAVAALCGLRAVVNYEGQAAVELEAAATTAGSGAGAYAMPVIDEGPGPLVIDARATVLEVVADLAAGSRPGVVAARFHATLAAATVDGLARAAERHGLSAVALSGGVFQNRLLLEAVAGGAAARGLRVLIGEQLPLNDGGISYGQAAVAAARLEREGMPG